jgi:hypothetical protein
MYNIKLKDYRQKRSKEKLIISRIRIRKRNIMFVENVSVLVGNIRSRYISGLGTGLEIVNYNNTIIVK